MSTQKLVILLAITSLLLFSAGCIGEDRTAEKISEEYKQKMEDLEDFSGTIYTTTYMGKQEMTTISTIAQKMPDKMKMVTLQAEKGEGTTLVSNGKTMWAYDQSQNIVVITELDSIDSYDTSQMDYIDAIQNLMDGNEITFDGMDNVNGRPSYAISINPDDDTTSGLCVDMKAWIDKETWMPLKYESYDVDGNLIMITEYKDIEVNTGIPDSEFVFDIPEGVDVVTFDSFAEFVAEEMPLEEEQQISESME
jgi:outer membrane lipoprotein-sorting protein